MDIARIRAVRGARPDVWIGVDANQGYTFGALNGLLDELVRAEVALLEQPLARGTKPICKDSHRRFQSLRTRAH